MFGRTGAETEGNERVGTPDKLDGTTGPELGASIATDTDDEGVITVVCIGEVVDDTDDVFSDWLVIFWYVTRLGNTESGLEDSIATAVDDKIPS